MSSQHKRPIVAFVVLAVLAAALIGNQIRASAEGSSFIAAGPIAAQTARTHGVVPGRTVDGQSGQALDQGAVTRNGADQQPMNSLLTNGAQVTRDQADRAPAVVASAVVGRGAPRSPGTAVSSAKAANTEAHTSSSAAGPPAGTPPSNSSGSSSGGSPERPASNSTGISHGKPAGMRPSNPSGTSDGESLGSSADTPVRRAAAQAQRHTTQAVRDVKVAAESVVRALTASGLLAPAGKTRAAGALPRPGLLHGLPAGGHRRAAAGDRPTASPVADDRAVLAVARHLSALVGTRAQDAPAATKCQVALAESGPQDEAPTEGPDHTSCSGDRHTGLGDLHGESDPDGHGYRNGSDHARR